MGSISRGFRLAGASWRVVRQDKELLILPVISFVAMLLVSAIFALGAVGIGLPSAGESPSPGLYVIGFLFYVALAFVTIFFNAAVIGTAMKRLEGQDAHLSDGLALARGHVGQIFVWAVITATVGMILRAIQERVGWLGRLLVGLLGVAWNVVTFFVTPVLLYEELGAVDAIRRSAQLFRQRWGEQFVGGATIGLAMFLLGIPIALVGALLVAASPVLGGVFLVIAIGSLAALGAALSGVFNAALYRFATSGRAPGPFSPDDLNAAFRLRRTGGAVGGGPMGSSGGFAG